MKIIRQTGGLCILILPCLFIWAVWFGLNPFLLKLIISDIILIALAMLIDSSMKEPKKS
jgi:hypothetical protein